MKIVDLCGLEDVIRVGEDALADEVCTRIRDEEKINHPKQRKENECRLHRFPISINQSINQSTNQPINQPTSQSVSQSVNQSISQSVNQSISQSVKQTNKQTIKQTIKHNSHQHSLNNIETNMSMRS